MTAGSTPIPAGGTAPAPPSHGWRVRRADTEIKGEDLSRIVSLSDGVFAFALTLLVLSISVPLAHTGGESNHELGVSLLNDWTTFLGYAFAFVMIAVWWLVHNRTFSYIARYDSTLVWINMALLAQIAIMPFVLTVYVDYEPLQYAIVLFSVIQITLGLTSTVLWEYARRNHLTKPGIDEAISRYFTRRGLLTALVFAISIGVSFVSTTWAQLSWIGIFVVMRALTYEGD